MGLPSWLKNDLWKGWDKHGRSTFLKECGKYINELKEEEKDRKKKADAAEPSESIMDVDESSTQCILVGPKGEQFKQAVYQLIHKGCQGVLKKDHVVGVLRELSSNHPHAASVIVDVMVTLDEETSVRQDLREKFIAIVRATDGFFNHMLTERINNDNLLELGIVPNKKVFTTKFIRIKTRIYYKQQKYNLCREESEGYAKLISELTPPFTSKDASLSTQVIQCLIGRFNLDPNRVLDIVLESFECQPISSFFVPVLENLKPAPATVCEIIGFKLQKQDGPVDSLFLLTALLLQHGIISLEGIYPWLTPDDKFIRKDWDRELKDAKEYARRSMIVTINKDKEEDQDDLTSPDDRYLDNQKFCLCEALLSIGAWENAVKLMDRLPMFSCISKKRIALKMIKFINYLIDPLYKNVRRMSKSLGANPCPTLINTDKAPAQVKSYGELSNNVEIIVTLGPYIYHDPVLMYKLLRIIKYYLEKNALKCGPLYYKFLTIFDEVILPGTSFLDANCPISEEIWSVLQYYPYHHRFRLYGSWKGESVLLLHPSLLRKRVDVVKKIKHLMRRISKENVKPMGRQLGKLAHSMPAVIFDYILSQIQLFDNLIAPVIDALKFLTSLSYDVLGYCLLEALSPSPNNSSGSMSVMLMPNRPRTKHDGSTIASWLQNLSSFTGAICKKYGIELVPLLQYISNQLKAKQGLDLLLLKEIVQKMTGIEAAEEMTTEQLDAMAGGELLRGEAGYFGQVRSSKKSGGRLREAVSLNDLAITLCVLMAQQRNCIIYDESPSLHTKLVGKLYDQCQDTLVQFGTFLANSCTVDDYAKKIPSLDKLVEEYHVSPDVAFFLWRPIFAYMIGVKYDELRRAEKGHKSMTVLQRQQKYSDAADHIFGPVSTVMRDFFPSKTWEDISPQFYVTFWSLSLYDLFVPSDAYSREVSRIRQLGVVAGDNKDLPSSKRKKEQERCAALIEKLQDEERRQREHVDRVMAKLNQEKDIWFASRTAKSAKNEAVTAFLQLCLFPRCIFTAPDALYCAHFVNIIHSLSTPNFSTLICYDRIFCDIIYTVTSCTENEANRYGRFLCALLGTVMKWHGDKSVFDKECASFPGFVTKFRAANTAMTESSDHVDYENYRHVCHKWHYKITKCIIVCLESKDFIQIRNALIVLKRILPYYPKVSNLATAVERWIERVRGEEKENRQDLFALATSYIGQLKARWGTLISEEDFHQKTAQDKPGGDKTRPKTASKDNDRAAAAPKDKRKPVSKPETPIPGSPVVSSSSSSSPIVTRIANGTISVANPVSTVKKDVPVSSPAPAPAPAPSPSPAPASAPAPAPAPAPSPTQTKPKEPEPEKPVLRKDSSPKEVRPVANSTSPGPEKPQHVKGPSLDTSKAEAVRRGADTPDAVRDSKRRKVDSSASKEEKAKEKTRRVKVREVKDDPVSASNGSGMSMSMDMSMGICESSVATISAIGLDTGSVNMVMPINDEKEKKRDKKKTDRKRDRGDSSQVELKTETKRKRSAENYKSVQGQKSTRITLIGNGEVSDKGRKERDKSPRQPSRERSYDASTAASKKHSTRYK